MATAGAAVLHLCVWWFAAMLHPATTQSVTTLATAASNHCNCNNLLCSCEQG